jgi:hypothetical protein
MRSGFMRSGFMRSGFMRSGFMRSGFMRSGLTVARRETNPVSAGNRIKNVIVGTLPTANRGRNRCRKFA